MFDWRKEMSLGFGSKCQLVAMDQDMVLYSYSSFNINLPNYEEYIDNLDGIILISKNYFPQPTIVKKRVRKPNKKKVWLEKKVYPEVDVNKLFQDGDIIIVNSSGCWEKNINGIDREALHLLFSIKQKYINSGEIPYEITCFR